MSNESVEVRAARLDEKINAIREDLTLARESRKQQYEMIEKISRTLINIDNRVTGVEESLAATKPTIDEFVNIKLKVQGAGIAGKTAWAIGAAVVGAIYTFRETLIKWFYT